ncbi:unnamed protein product [Sympodiomycopsis kandeliae]
MASTTKKSPIPAKLEQLAKAKGVDVESFELAQLADTQDPLSALREEYHIPLKESAQQEQWPADLSAPLPSSSAASLYLCGNSLGPLPKLTRKLLMEEVDAWGTHSVLGHFNHPHGKERQWTKMEERVNAIMSDIVGAKPSEVTAMNTLTGNLHTVLQTFYRPLARPQGIRSSSNQTAKVKHKIIHEVAPFPSDQYALVSTVQLNNLDPETSLVELKPREGQDTIQTDDIIAVMEREAATGECWGILLGGIQYLTGQLFELEKITKRAHELDLMVGLDLAHAFANVPLQLHDWQVDFAVWCTYKYGSAGPGGIGGLFVHENWTNGQSERVLRPSGWWGHNKTTRFAMPKEFDPMDGAAGFQVSNPSMLDITALRGSLETLALAVKDSKGVFGEEWISTRNQDSTIGSGSIMPILREKSIQLTNYLEYLLFSSSRFSPTLAKIQMKLITPVIQEQRGSQLSIRIPNLLAHQQQKQIDNAKETGAVPPPISKETLLSKVHKRVEMKYGLIADIRNPDIIRLAPLAQYSTFQDVWNAVDALAKSVEEVTNEEGL